MTDSAFIPLSETGRPRYLVLDAATREIVVGVIGAIGWEGRAQADGDALETIFRLSREALEQAGAAGMESLDGVLFCRGPGSLLGLRLAAMAVSTWKVLPEMERWELRQYHSLEWMAAARILQGEEDFHLLSPFRKDLFNHLHIQSGQAGEPGLISADSLSGQKGKVYFIGNGTLRLDPPEGALPLDYSLDALPEVFRAKPELFRGVNQPEVVVPQAPVFAEWTAQRHRGKGSL